MTRVKFAYPANAGYKLALVEAADSCKVKFAPPATTSAAENRGQATREIARRNFQAVLDSESMIECIKKYGFVENNK